MLPPRRRSKKYDARCNGSERALMSRWIPNLVTAPSPQSSTGGIRWFSSIASAGHVIERGGVSSSIFAHCEPHLALNTRELLSRWEDVLFKRLADLGLIEIGRHPRGE